MLAPLKSALDVVRSLDRRMTRGIRRKILFNARTAMNYAMVAPIHRVMAADPRVEFFFTATEAPRQAGAIFREAGTGARIISPRRAALMRFDSYIAADLLWLTLPRGTRRVQMFHGVAGKYAHDYDRPTTSMRQWDAHFFVNERRLRNFLAARAIDDNPGSARLIGMPKVDCLVDGSLTRDAALRRLDLDPGLPTIMYAPTWSAASSINVLGLALIERLLARPWNVIVKLHDRLRDPRPFYSGGLDWGARLEPLLAGPRARLASGADVCPYLAGADVLITDHSSAGFEYLLLDRPLVRIHVPELLQTSNTSREYVDLLAAAARTGTDVATVLAAVDDSLTDPGYLSASRVAVANDLFYRPGTATARAVEALYELIELDAPVLGRFNRERRFAA